jgi:predicted RNase H-like nuclease (RuvC/YqgF family)
VIEPALIVALIAAVVGPVGTYIIAGRRLSGRIDTTEAASLWEESRAMRTDYRDRLAEAEKRMAKLEARIADEERANTTLTRENIDLIAKNQECEWKIEKLRERVAMLDREKVLLRETIESIVKEDPTRGA